MIGKLLLTTVITLGSIGITSPFAYSQVNGGSTITGYGTYYYTYTTELSTFDYLFGTLRLVGTGYSSTLHYELNQKYTGTITLKATTTDVFNRVNVYTHNCTIMGKNSSTLEYTIRLHGVDNFDVSFVVPTQTAINTMSGQIMGITGYSFTGVEDITGTVENIESTVDAIDVQLTTMQQSISQILTVEQASRTLLAEIEYALRGNNSLYVLSDDMQTIVADLNGINQIVSTMATDINSLVTVANEIKYNQMYVPPHARMFMECITRQDITKIQHDVYGNYVVIDSNPYRMYMTYNTPMVFVYETNVTDVIPSFYSDHCTVTTLGFVRSATAIYYAIKVESTSNGYKDFTWQYPNNKKIYPLYLGPQTTMPAEFQFILRDYFNDAYINRLDMIKNAINNMSVNVNNMTVNATGITYNVNNTQVDNSVTQYNTTINQVHGVEDGFGTTFNQYNEQFTPTTDQTIMDKFNATSGLVNSVITGVDGIDFFKVPITLVLVGIVLMAILG